MFVLNRDDFKEASEAYNILLVDQSSCTSRSIAIMHLFTRVNEFKSIHYVRILIQLPCPRITCYCVILGNGCSTEG